MSINYEDAEFYCVGCHKSISISEDALALSPFERNLSLLVMLHRDERCARRYYLNRPAWCSAPPDLDQPPAAGWYRRVGFEVTCWGDKRGYARAHYRGARCAVGEAA